MLLAIAILFMITIFPFALLIVSQALFDWANKSYPNYIFSVMYEISVMLFIVNHSINFCLYCLSAQFFRQATRDLFFACFPCFKSG